MQYHVENLWVTKLQDDIEKLGIRITRMNSLKKANFLVVLNNCSVLPLEEGKQSIMVKETMHYARKEEAIRIPATI